MLSVHAGNRETAELLLENSANPNSKDDEGNTVFMKALLAGHKEMCGWLIQLGADIDGVNNHGETPESIARAGGLMTLVETIKNALFMRAVKMGKRRPHARAQVADDAESDDSDEMMRQERERLRNYKYKVYGPDGEEEEEVPFQPMQGMTETMTARTSESGADFD
mmetsp:Transcript_34466/g.109159  ORF Transcript_34466/g.109159 Transcript_34466/m.109159 type:complete len:166 (-) Transcript_34466:96-593(-)